MLNFHNIMTAIVVLYYLLWPYTSIQVSLNILDFSPLYVYLNLSYCSFGPLSESVYQRYTKQIMEATVYIHKQGVIHRYL